MPLAFRKLHGLGNDFVLFQGLDEPLPLEQLTDPNVARWICDRHRGVGADGLLLLLPPEGAKAQAKMRIINADGSEPEMCGNGIRCLAKVLHDHYPQFSGSSRLSIETGAGLLHCDLTLDTRHQVAAVKVDMGRPRLERPEIPMTGGSGLWVGQTLELKGHSFLASAVSMGNPHLVLFLQDAPEQDLHQLARELGPELEHHPDFPNRTNVEFARLSRVNGEGLAAAPGQSSPEAGAPIPETKINPEIDASLEIETWVWERGCGITQACGTGACATAVAAQINHLNPQAEPLRIKLPGGVLSIQVADDLSRVWMEGPAEAVFEGRLPLPLPGH